MRTQHENDYATPTGRTHGSTRYHPITSGLVRLAVAVAGVLALVASALVTGATFALAMELLPTTIPTLMAGWAVAIGLTFALPMVVVRGVVAVLERTQ